MTENNPTSERLLLLFQKYDRMLHKYSYIYGHFDMDLYSECKISLFLCIRNFHFDEIHFRMQYREYLKANAEST